MAFVAPGPLMRDERYFHSHGHMASVGCTATLVDCCCSSQRCCQSATRAWQHLAALLSVTARRRRRMRRERCPQHRLQALQSSQSVHLQMQLWYVYCSNISNKTRRSNYSMTCLQVSPRTASKRKADDDGDAPAARQPQDPNPKTDHSPSKKIKAVSGAQQVRLMSRSRL